MLQFFSDFFKEDSRYTRLAEMYNNLFTANEEKRVECERLRKENNTLMGGLHEEQMAVQDAHEDCYRMQEQIKELTTERDTWKAKAQHRRVKA